MDLIVAKLEELGLEEFIDSYRFYLCKITVSPLKVAVALTFDADQCAIITHPPDNFSKCEKLYELVQKKSEVKDFLEALDETGNEHILKFIKDTELSASTQTASTLANQHQSRGIWFNIPEPIESFCGREDFLTQLHNQLKPRDDSETEVTVLSQVKIVSGLGGIGKTETARRYIMKQRKLYNNFIWINAETDNLMTNSFLRLAAEIKIPVKNAEGKSREIQEIVKEIYNRICACGRSNLIIFDNAEDYQSCRQFFPFGLHPDLTKPVILATSRNQEWISSTGKIQVLPLDVLTERESLEFLLKELEIPESEIPEFTEEAKEFIQLIGGLPLALQQAVAYIKHQTKANGLLSRPYKLGDYVQQFKSSAEKLQKFPHAPDSSTTVFITWNLTLEKIKEDSQGKIAIEMIEVMSFLYADKIPFELLLQVLPLPPPPLPPQNWINRLCKACRQQQHDDFELESTDLVEGLNLLEKFSMIKITGNFLSIHRQVQFVILQNLKSSGRLINFFNHLIEKCLVVLEYMNLSKSSDIFLNIHQIVNNQFDLIPVTETFVHFMHIFASILYTASRYSESLDLCKTVYSNYRDLLGENDPNTLASQHQMALNVDKLGRYDEALTLYRENLKKQELHPDLGLDHLSTIITKHNIAHTLKQLGRLQESLELFQQVEAQMITVYGENHPQTLISQNQIAGLYASLGDLPKALLLYEHVDRKQMEILGPDDTNVLTTKQHKAFVLIKMGQIKEASRILNELYERQKETLGENHLNTIYSLGCIASTLELEGKLTEALDIYQKMYKVEEDNLGQNHSKTLTTQSFIALVTSRMGNFSKALDLFEHVEKEQTQLLGPDNEGVLITNHNKAFALYKMGKLEEAYRIFNEVYEKRKLLFGENHYNTVRALYRIGTTLEKQGEFKQALNQLNKVYKSYEALWGEDNFHAIKVKSRITKIEKKIESRGNCTCLRFTNLQVLGILPNVLFCS